VAEREVRYCTTEDEIRVAFCTEGTGPTIVCLSLFVESFALEHMLPAYQAFMRRLGEGRRTVRYDGRGIGLSERDPSELSPNTLTRDLAAVVDASEASRVVIWASTTGGPAALKYTAENPERVIALVLYGCWAWPGDIFSEAMRLGFAGIAGGDWTLGSQVFADMTGRKEHPEECARLAEWYRQSADAAHMARLITDVGTVDARPFLKQIKVPTLILHRVNDPTVPFRIGQQMAKEIPLARLVPLEGNAHGFFLGDPGAVLDAVNSFLDAIPDAARSERTEIPQDRGPLRTVLFTDLVGHTEMMSRLGDERGRAVLREHETITRNVLKTHGGTEIKTMGDGFMASFGSVTKSVECAIALQQAFAEREGEPLAVRVGLNAGEPIEEDGDLFGATVIMASRIATKAEGGEILVADTVRGLCSGKGFLFADRGEFVAKGFEEPVRVYEVKWRE
jgi:class 3 adenylate cyclase/pimeloyl-ACP methyl ester carboxylesterase